MPGFLTTVTPSEAQALLETFAAGKTPVERVALDQALGRVLAEDFQAPEPLPGFDRSTMDGYAIRAGDSHGGSESAPAYLRVAGRIRMGEAPAVALRAGEAMEISTGGALPPGADAVVMVEHCREVAGQIEVSRPAAVGENVIRAGDDVAPGARILSAGMRLGPARIAALAAFGAVEVPVHARPRVGIVSTGDELVPTAEPPPRGMVRDVNAPALAAQVVEAGGAPRLWGIVRDERAALEARLREALAASDLVLVSGGSSQGVRDMTAAVLDGLGPPGVLAHGISVAPGKPTILARAGETPILGMPGHPVSSMVIFRVFVSRLVRRLGGEAGPCDPFPGRRRARLSRKVPSKAGREDYQRVALREEQDGVWADPLLGGSAAVSTIARADGLVRIPLLAEGIAAGEEVEVLLWAS